MPEDAIAQNILDEIKRLATRFERLDGRISTVENRMSNIETVVADLDVRLKTRPDMRFVAGAAKAQSSRYAEIEVDISDIGVRIREIYQPTAIVCRNQELA